MHELKPLDDHNFLHFITLLNERGEAPEVYYRWKYMSQPSHGKPTGFIAYLNGQPVGCIGVVNRMLCSEDGKYYPVTWFADWFLTKESRGKGIGKLLMDKVRMLAPYGFGIPGPLTARQVCSRAGYYPMEGVIDIVLYLQPFRCGYFRGRGSSLKRLLRGMKNEVTSFSSILKLRFTRQAIFSKDFNLNGKAVSEHYRIKSAASISLHRDEEFINWISEMPVSSSSVRYWWTIEGIGFFSWGFFEKDFWGLNKAQILDIVSTTEQEAYIPVICKTLLKQGIDFVKYISSSQYHSAESSYQYPLPVYYSGPQLPGNFSLSSLDKESSWREFTMK